MVLPPPRSRWGCIRTSSMHRKKCSATRTTPHQHNTEQPPFALVRAFFGLRPPRLRRQPNPKKTNSPPPKLCFRLRRAARGEDGGRFFEGCVFLLYIDRGQDCFTISGIRFAACSAWPLPRLFHGEDRCQARIQHFHHIAFVILCSCLTFLFKSRPFATRTCLLLFCV